MEGEEANLKTKLAGDANGVMTLCTDIVAAICRGMFEGVRFAERQEAGEPQGWQLPSGAISGVDYSVPFRISANFDFQPITVLLLPSTPKAGE